MYHMCNCGHLLWNKTSKDTVAAVTKIQSCWNDVAYSCILHLISEFSALHASHEASIDSTYDYAQLPKSGDTLWCTTCVTCITYIFADNKLYMYKYIYIYEYILLFYLIDTLLLIGWIILDCAFSGILACPLLRQLLIGRKTSNCAKLLALIIYKP